MAENRAFYLFSATRQGARRRAEQFGFKPLSAGDVKSLIGIAASCSPSSAIQYATAEIAVHRPDLFRDAVLTSLIARATRWLAVIRRDEGEEAFQRAVQVWMVEVEE